MGAVLTPCTLVDAAVRELTEACTIPHIILEVSLVDLAVRVYQLALSILDSLGYATFVNDICHVLKIGLRLLEEVHPVAGHAGSQDLRHNEISAIWVL